MTLPFDARAETIVGRLARHAAERPGAPAVLTAERTIGYGELAATVAGCAAWLNGQGVRPGDCAGVTIGDDHLHYVVALALAALGAAHATLPSFDPEPARARLAERLRMRWVIGERSAHRLSGLKFLAVEPGSTRAWQDAHAPLPPEPDASSLFTFFASSGTTGESKIVPVRHGQMIPQSARSRTGRALPLAGIEHSYAKRQYLYAAVSGTAIALRGSADEPIQHLCRELNIDLVAGMSFHLDALLADVPEHGRLPPFTALQTGGARCSAKFRADLLARVCDELRVLYSAQECGAAACAVERAPAQASETVGRPLSGVVIAVVDDDGRPVPDGETGEVRIRAPGMSTSYIDDPGATARHFRDGWFQPGDLGSITPEGALVVHGRADDVMILNSIKIAPAEIERALERHPAVKAVAAFPVRSPVHGDVPVAAVELHDGAVAGERELQDFARRLLGLRGPRRIVIVATMPATRQGKVDKRRLAESYSGLAR